MRRLQDSGGRTQRSPSEALAYLRSVGAQALVLAWPCVRRGRLNLLRAPIARSALGLGLSRIVAGGLLFVASVESHVSLGPALGMFGLTSTVGLYAARSPTPGRRDTLFLSRPAAETEWPSAWANARRFELRSTVPCSRCICDPRRRIHERTERLALLAAVPWWLLLRLNLALRSVFTAAEESAPMLGARSSIDRRADRYLPRGRAHTLGSDRYPRISAGALVHRRSSSRARYLGVQPGAAVQSASRSLSALPYAAGTTLTILYLRIDIPSRGLRESARHLGLYQAPLRFAAAASSFRTP